MQIYYSTDEETTLAIAQSFCKELKQGDIVLLRGDLGAGKSVFARGLAAGWGVKGHVTSPSFTTMQQYRGEKGLFHHFDLYRMSDPEELFDTGLNEYLGGDALAAVEWPENGLLDPDDAYTVFVERVDASELPEGMSLAEESDGFARRITILAPGEVREG